MGSGPDRRVLRFTFPKPPQSTIQLTELLFETLLEPSQSLDVGRHLELREAEPPRPEREPAPRGGCGFHRGRPHPALPHVLHGDLAPGLSIRDRGADVGGVPHGLVCDARHNVPALEAGLSGWASRLHLHHERALVVRHSHGIAKLGSRLDDAEAEPHGCLYDAPEGSGGGRRDRDEGGVGGGAQPRV